MDNLPNKPIVNMDIHILGRTFIGIRMVIIGAELALISGRTYIGNATEIS